MSVVAAGGTAEFSINGARKFCIAGPLESCARAECHTVTVHGVPSTVPDTVVKSLAVIAEDIV